MATSTLTLPHLVTWISLLCGTFHISGAISIQHRKAPVLASSNDTAVTLPCDFTTSSYETPQITWYRERTETERRQIMQFDIHNSLSTHGEFVNRVARGDRGALVLLSPRPTDSGNYTCEVEVDNEVPSWVKTTVILNVTEEVTPLPETSSNTAEKENGGLLFLVALFWILPMTCSFLLVRNELFLCGRTQEKPRKKTPASLLIIARRPVVVVLVMALCFFFTAIICTAVALSSSTPETTTYYSGAGLGTGLVGTLLLVAALVWLCVRPKLLKKKPNNAKDAETGNKELNLSMVSIDETFHDANADTPDTLSSPQWKDTAVKPDENKSLLPQTAAVKVKKPEPEVKILDTPEGQIVTGMTAMSYKDIYLTTKSDVYHLDLTEGSRSTRLTHLFKRKEDLFAITKYKNDLLLTAMKRKPKNDTSRLLHVKKPENKTEKIPLDSQATLTWTLTNRDEKFLYLCMANPAMVVKKSMEKKKTKIFGEGVLKYPTCIVQNSSGELVVADSHMHDLLVFKEDCEFVTSMKISVPKKLEDEMKGCNRLAVGPDGRIYATGQASKHILIFTPDFRFERLLPTTAVGNSSISCLMVHQDSLYVAHEDCIRVHRLQSRSSMSGD